MVGANAPFIRKILRFRILSNVTHYKSKSHFCRRFIVNIGQLKCFILHLQLNVISAFWCCWELRNLSLASSNFSFWFLMEFSDFCIDSGTSTKQSVLTNRAVCHRWRALNAQSNRLVQPKINCANHDIEMFSANFY